MEMFDNLGITKFDWTFVGDDALIVPSNNQDI